MKENQELDKNSVCANFAHTVEDGKIYNTKYYSLRAITTVGYRVNSYKATENSYVKTIEEKLCR